MDAKRETWQQLKGLSAAYIADHLKKSKQSPRGYRACCPAHDDRVPDLEIWDVDDGFAVKCWAGCSDANIREAIANLLPNGYRTDFTSRPKTPKKTPKSEADERRTAANNANSIILRSAPATTDHPYIKRKGVEIQGKLYHCHLTKAQMKATLKTTPHAKGEHLKPPYLAVPVTDGHELIGLQLIGSCGLKYFIHGTRNKVKQWATEKLPERLERPLVIGEGIATVLSATQGTGHYGEAGFNFDGVIKLLAQRRAEHPDADIYLLAENCKRTRKVFNAEKLYAAAKQYNAKVIVPTTTGSDFNDQHAEYGLESVIHSINAQMIDVGKYKNKAVYAALNDKNLKGFKPKVEAALESENQASWVFYLCWRFLYRHSYTLPRPSEFIAQFNLSEIEREELSTYFEWRLLFRTHRALNPYRLSRSDLHLTRDENDELDWEEAQRKASASHAKVILVCSDHGSAKTSKFAKLFVRPGFEMLVHRAPLGQSSANTLKIDYRGDPNDWATGSVAGCYQAYFQNGEPNRRLNEHPFKDPKVYCIDEINQLVKDFACTPFIKSERDRKATLEEIKRRSRGAEQFIAMDADASDGAVLFVADLCGIDPKDVFVITTEPSKKAFKARLTFEASHSRDGLNRALNYDGKCCVAIEGRGKARAFYKRAIKKGKRVVLIANCDESSNIESLYDLDDIDMVIYTSKMGTGVSVEHKDFKKCFALFYGYVLTAADAVQMLRRFRYAVDFDITVITQHKIKFSDLPELPEYAPDLPEAAGIELEDWQAYFAHEEVFEKAHFAPAFEQLLKQRNFEIERASLDFDDVVSTKEQKLGEIESTLNARRIPSPHNKVENDQQRHENRRHLTEQAYGVVTADTVKRYYDDRPMAERLYKLKRHDEEWQPVAEIISTLKSNMTRSDCLQSFKLITANYELFKRMRAIPEAWTAHKKQRQPSAGNLASFARHYGFESELIGDRGDWLKLSSDVFDIEQTLTKEDKKADKKAEAIRLRDEDPKKSVRKIADAVGESKSKVARWLKNDCPKITKSEENYNTSSQFTQKWDTQKVTNSDSPAPLEVIPNPALALEDQPTDAEIMPEVLPIFGLKRVGGSYQIDPDAIQPALTVGAVFALNGLTGLSQNQRRRYLNRRKRELAAILSAEPAPQPPESQLTPNERLARAMVGYPGTRILMGGDTG